MTDDDSCHATGDDGHVAGDAERPGWPNGFVGLDDVLRRLGVSRKTLNDWVRDGRFAYAGVLVQVHGRQPRKYRAFDPAEVERARQRMLDTAADWEQAKADRREARKAAAVLPDGFVDRHEAARRLGIVTMTLKRYADEGRVPAARMIQTASGRPKLAYAIAELDLAKAAMDEARAAYALPDGYADRDHAAALFGVTETTWNKWERLGRVPTGEWGRSRTNKPIRIYRVTELTRLLNEMRADDVAYRTPGRHGTYNTPSGFVRWAQAAKMFGISYQTLHRWEKQGRLTCGERVNGGGPKLYPIAELQRLVAENGSMRPPYPDADRPGVLRVPLTGHDMLRREAIIDAVDLPVVENKHLHWSDRGGEGAGQVMLWDGERQVRLRQAILGLFDSEARIGHVNGDPLDCRRENLMLRTRQHVERAKPKKKGYAGRPCSSQFKGVCFEKRTGKWAVGIVVDRKNIRVGRFSDELAAAQAYDDAAREYFGEQARPNFPDGVDAWLEQQHVPDRAAA